MISPFPSTSATYETFPLELTEIRETETFGEWKTALEELQQKSDAVIVILYFSIKDTYNKRVPADQIINWTVYKSQVPIIGMWDFSVESGAALSVPIISYDEGVETAKTIVKLLKGAKPSDIRITKPGYKSIYLNTETLKRLGLNTEIKKLPPKYKDYKIEYIH